MESIENNKLLSKINNVEVDRYGVVSGVFAIDKPVWVMSHDVVSQIRRRLGTRTVGHAGALDPFASGVLLILVGKKYTKHSDALLNMSKTYVMRILLGVQSISLDIESPITKVNDDYQTISEETIQQILRSFDGGYKQQVPIYSSVKVNGKKLRVLARGSNGFKLTTKDSKVYVIFEKFAGRDIEFEVPTKEVKLSDIKLIATGNIDNQNLPDRWEYGKLPDFPLQYADVEFTCSKGTYARQFAADIANKLGTVGMLIGLTRTRVGDISLPECIKLEDINYPNFQVY